MSEPTTQLIEAVNNKDLIGIYGIITLIAHKTRSFSNNEFIDAIEYVKKHNIPDFIKPFDGRKLEPKENWTEEYWETVLFSLNTNFSEERINHLKEISAYLYPKNEKHSPVSQTNVDNKTKAENKQSSSANQGNDFSKKIIPIAATAGAALVCLAALAIGSKKIAAAVWIVAIAAGAYTVLKKEE